MRPLRVRPRRLFALSFLTLATLGNVGAIGCNGSGSDDGFGGEGGEKPASGGDKGSGGSKASGGGKATGGGRASGGSKATGGSGGRAATGGAAGAGTGGVESETAFDKACRTWAEHLVDEAEGTACEVDAEQHTENCRSEPPAAECLEDQLALFDCYSGVDYSCEEEASPEGPVLINTSPDCNDLIDAAMECQRLADTSPVCAVFAKRGKNVTANLGCSDGDDEDESVFYSIRACERKMDPESCAGQAKTLFECLTEAPEADWRCADTGVAVPKQSICGAQRDALDTCLLSDTDPTCNSFGHWYAATSEAIDCDMNLAYAVTNCEEMMSEPSCSSEGSTYFSCLENSSSYWLCGDESGIYPDSPICTAEQTELDGCRSCKDMPTTTSAQITITAADQYKLWVNGALVSETAPSWSSAETYTITLDPRPYRPNVIAIQANNVDVSADGLDRIAVASVSLGSETLVTDALWLAYEGAALDPDWVLPSYDTSFFVPATSYGEHGSLEPWGEVDPNLNGAEWIWASGADGLAAEKADAQTVYLRRTFYVGPGGLFSEEPSSCQ